LKPRGAHPILRFLLIGENEERSLPVRVFNYFLALLVIAFFIYLSFYQLTTLAGWRKLAGYWPAFAKGWLVTIAISMAALVLSGCLGALLALCRKSRVLVLRDFSKMYTEVIRGTPLLVQILIFYFGIYHQIGIENSYVAGVLILAGFHGAYIGEIIRAGVEGVGQSQLDSARAIGLTRMQTFRHVIFPQTIRRILPPLAGEFASVIKNSSLLSIIGLNELTQSAENANTSTFSTLESYFPLAIGYLVLTLPISLWTQAMERKHKFET
jgi:polar amino acid transport system permease protein